MLFGNVYRLYPSDNVNISWFSSGTEPSICFLTLSAIILGNITGNPINKNMVTRAITMIITAASSSTVINTSPQLLISLL